MKTGEQCLPQVIEYSICPGCVAAKKPQALETTNQEIISGWGEPWPEADERKDGFKQLRAIPAYKSLMHGARDRLRARQLTEATVAPIQAKPLASLFDGLWRDASRQAPGRPVIGNML